MIRFPRDFRFGLATSAFQIEGAAREDGRSPSIWDTFCEQPGAISDGSNALVACDHYRRFREDVELLRWFGVDTYRFSVSWSRVMPDGTGSVNARGLDFYERLVDALLEAGIEPCVTLFHWDLPEALERRGGFRVRGTAEAFADYASVVLRRLGDRARTVLTLNEPWCAAFLGHETGLFAPGERDLSAALAVSHHLLLGHGLAVQAVRAAAPASRVGVAPNLAAPYPASSDPADAAAARRFDGYFNRWFLDPLAGRGYPADMLQLYGSRMLDVREDDLRTIGQPLDFLGINYYNPQRIQHAPGHGPLELREIPDPALPHTADRSVDASWLRKLLVRLHSEYPFKEFVISENGAAYPDAPDAEGAVLDPERISFLEAHFREASRAIEAGVPLTGYYVWSLLDNFEWSRGYELRYGLTYVDFSSQRRTPKASAHWYRRFLAER
jgi:beta-glucosidase